MQRLDLLFCPYLQLSMGRDMQKVAWICLGLGVTLVVISFVTFIGFPAFLTEVPARFQSQELGWAFIFLIMAAFILGAVLVAIGLLLTAIAVVRRALARH